ncbi:unnamed protein product [Absidia cylindrospora]
MERIKKVMTLNDDEIILIAINHLRGKAGHWWEHTEPKVSTWKDFITEFNKEYVQGNDNLDFYLDKLENYKRRKDQSIDELVNSLNNLCDKVNIKDDRYKVRKFVRSMEPALAMELEKNGPFTSINTAATEAKRLEHVLSKYGSASDTSPPPSVLSRAESVVSDSMLDLMKRLEALQVNTLAVASKQSGAGTGGDYGRMERGGGGTNHSGSGNNDYYGNGNDARRGVRFADGTLVEQGRRPICFVSLSAADDPRLSAQQQQQPSQQSQQQQPSQQSQQQQPVAATGKENPINFVELSGAEIYNKRRAVEASEGQSIQDTTAIKVVTPPKKDKAKRKRRSKPVRRLVVPLEKKDVWDRLQQLDSGLSMADWLAMDKSAYADTRDGLRHFHIKARKPKTDGFVTNEPMAVNTLDQNDDLTSDSTTTSDSWTDTSSVFSSSTEYSRMGYEYSLSNMKASSPFKARIVIGNEIILAVFDSGASVSVIGSALATRLRLVPVGDKLSLMGFDGKTNHDCDIVVDVPIRVAGKLRPEHMCIQSGVERDICLLGMTWFKAYGVKQDMERGLLTLPTGDGKDHVELKAESYTGVEHNMVSAMVMGVDVDDQDSEGDKVDFDEAIGSVDDALKAVILKNKDSFVEISGLGKVDSCTHSILLKTNEAQPVSLRNMVRTNLR